MKNIYCFLIFLIICSCSSVSQLVTVEVSKPSELMLPNRIQSLTLMNRSISDDFLNFNEDTLQKYFYSQGFNLGKIVLDNLASDTTLRVLGDLLYSSGRYDVVIPQERNIARDLIFYSIPKELDWDEVTSICEQFDTDALLVLERYFNKIDTKHAFHPASYDTPDYVSATINSGYNALIRIYDPVEKEILKSIILADTISWGNADLTDQELFSGLPSIKGCLIQTGICIALDANTLLSPVWSSEDRIYFRMSKNEDELKKLIAENDWQSVYDYWLDYANATKKSDISKAYFNMALASEMIGDIDGAFEWINKSYNTQYRVQTEKYIVQLTNRKRVIDEFKKFDD